jgi:hypothetical protein
MNPAPLIKGGQGRTGEDLEHDAERIVVALAACAAALGSLFIISFLHQWLGR